MRQWVDIARDLTNRKFKPPCFGHTGKIRFNLAAKRLTRLECIHRQFFPLDLSTTGPGIALSQFVAHLEPV